MRGHLEVWMSNMQSKRYNHCGIPNVCLDSDLSYSKTPYKHIHTSKKRYIVDAQIFIYRTKKHSINT